MAPFPQLPDLPGPLAHKLSSLAGHILVQPTATTNPATPALERRQTAAAATVTVVQSNSGGGGHDSSNDNLSGGAIAGIVIGSICGFLLLWWIIYSCGNFGSPSGNAGRADGGPWYGGVRDEGGNYYPEGRSRSRRRKSSEVRHVRPVVVTAPAAQSPRPPAYAYERDSRDVRRGRRAQRSASRY